MTSHVVLTLTGKDRVGIVEQITQSLLSLGGNVEASQMARLGGEFAVLMLVALPTEQASRISAVFEPLTAQGFKVTASPTELAGARPAGWTPFRIEVAGADHQGIIHEIAQSLAKQGISVERLETGTDSAPVTGTPLFTMDAQVLVPPAVTGNAWKLALQDAGGKLNVDISISAE
jgi:glycine cleavage system transcriptional repressor